MFKRIFKTAFNSKEPRNGIMHNRDKMKQKDIKDPDAISSCLKDNKSVINKRFNSSIDLKMYDFETVSGIKTLVIYIEEIIKKEVLDRDVINPFISDSNKISYKKQDVIESFKKIFPVSNIKVIESISQAIQNILDGNAVFFIEDLNIAFAVPSRGWEKRAIEEPLSEAVIRGPKEGFIEAISINRSLLRRKIKNENLIFEEIIIGEQTKTNVNIVYIAGIVNLEVLKEVRIRLSKIDTDAILDAGYIEEFIEDSHLSPISTVGNTQKPDIVAAKILEGRVAIFCDGSPHVLTVPHLFMETIQTSEDYYIRPYIATVLRMVRLSAFIISILLPAFYVALETYHQEMIPTVLLITMTGANEGTPLPAFAEALLMVVALEFLKESGTRLPRAIGSAISIVGALVLGDAAVKAGVISADLIIVIAFTAVSTFIVPALNEVITLYRIVFLILGGVMGIYGITGGFFVAIIFATSLRSFGIPYMSTLAPINLEGLKDFLIRFPRRSMKRRPSAISKRNNKRQQ